MLKALYCMSSAGKRPAVCVSNSTQELTGICRWFNNNHALSGGAKPTPPTFAALYKQTSKRAMQESVDSCGLRLNRINSLIVWMTISSSLAP